MKKISALIIAALLVLSLAVISAGADAYNPNGGCEAKINVKKADPAKVIKDGIIGEGEYEEYDINRDPDSTDLLFSWYGSSAMYDKCAQFLPTLHFYFSWDEVHGLNIAVTAKHCEEIVQTKEQPGEDAMSHDGMTFPGDEYISSVGMMLRCYRNQDSDGDGQKDMVFYRGVSKRTDNGQYLIGYYWDAHGYNQNVSFKAEENIYITYGPDNTVTYEMSVPLDAVAEHAAVGDVIPFDLSVVGGSDPRPLNQSSDTYVVSIGDEGYCTTKSATINRDNGYFTIVADTIEAAGNNDQPSVDDPSSGGNNDGQNTSGGNTTDTPVDSGSKNASETPYGSADTTDPTAPKSNTDGGNKTNTKTGDAMVILAVVSSLSACGVVIGKKRK